MRTLTICLFIIAIFTLPLESKAMEKMDHAKLIEEARSYFKIGYVLHKQGLETMALQALKKSQSLLLQAGKQEDATQHLQLDAALQDYYDKLFFPKPDPTHGYNSNSRWSRTKFDTLAHQEHVRAQINRLTTKNRNFLESSLLKSQKFMPMIRKEFINHGIPLELVYVALIESGFDTNALSHAGARGMWQFMPATAKIYGLEVSNNRDDRLCPIKSTTAAAMYLKKLYNQFNNWPLALAAYNCGETRVANAMKKHNAKTFWELLQYNALPRETLNYVPSILAVAIISQDLTMYGISSR